MYLIKELTAYLAIPSISAQKAHTADIQAAHGFVSKYLSALGFSVEKIETPLHPIVLAERLGKPGYPHIILYGHYDVQPADPLDRWHTPPFTPTIKDGRIYARGATDNKGPLMAQLWGLKKVLESNPDYPVSVTVLVEGEEEIGSPSFPGFLEKYHARLSKADYLVVSDTGSPSSEQLVVTTALRGLIDLEVRLYGPAYDLHSGLNGGAVRNPIEALCALCAGLHDEKGNVNVPGFYDAVQTPFEWEKAELKKYPMDEKAYKALVGVPELYSPQGYSPLEAIRFAPTLEFNGIGGGYQGQGSKTIIPAEAFVKITCRLVPNQEPQTIRKLVEKTLLERAPKGVRLEVLLRDGGGPYLITPPHKLEGAKQESSRLHRAFSDLENAIETTIGKKPLYLREGGSIPIIGQIKQITGLDTILLGLSLPEDKMHGPNEGYSLNMLKNAVALYQKFFSNLAK